MKIILIFTILYGLIPLIYYNIYGKKTLLIKSIYPFLVVVFIASLYEFFGSLILKKSLENWYLIYTTLAFFSLHYFFYTILNKKHKSFFVLFILIFIFFIILTFNYWNNIFFMEINAYFNTLQTIIVLTFSALWFVKTFKELELKSLVDSPIFLIISGLIITYCGTVFLFLLAELLYKIDKSSFQDYWMLNIILNLLLRTTLIIGIWKARTK